MNPTRTYTPEELRYLKMLSRQYPTVRAAGTEIINLQAIMNLPKGCEHFISDVHGEYEAFLHILNSCSGVVRERLDFLYQDSVPRAELDQLATLIYYPEEKMEELRPQIEDLDEWYRITLNRLMEVCRLVTARYSRSKVRKAIPADYTYIIEELLHTHSEEIDKQDYYKNIITTIVDIGQAPDVIVAVCELIKWAAVDHLHLVGDIFDRGPRADIIMDSLLHHHSVDIQWGNHDILWMGAAAGNPASIFVCINNNVKYGNYEVLENGYGISMRNLVLFAEKTYSKEEGMDPLKKAISVLIFKLEGQLIKRHPEYRMQNRLLLGQVDWDNYTITLDGVTHHLKTRDFPTVDPGNPFRLSPEEKEVVKDLVHAFTHSVRLRQHVNFLYSHGSMYKCVNENLLYHGCMPLDEDGNFARVDFWGEPLQGRAYLDKVDQEVRKAWSAPDESCVDFLWYLWCGIDSPLFGRVIKTFERTYLEDKSTWKEPRNPYYVFNREKRTAKMILHEFGLYSERSHIINGHTPVNVKKGESPIRADGKLYVIDGGFCKAYQKATGIAGYTLIFNSHGMKLKTHQPFESLKKALEENVDIHSDTEIVEVEDRRIMVGDTDQGVIIRERIKDLKELLKAYRSGLVRER